MYQRIKDQHDLDQLQIGMLVIQYPLNGLMIEDLDLFVSDDFELYEVESVNSENVRLLLRADIICQDGKGSGFSDISTANDLSKFIVKQTETMLRDQNWWQDEDRKTK